MGLAFSAPALEGSLEGGVKERLAPADEGPFLSVQQPSVSAETLVIYSSQGPAGGAVGSRAPPTSAPGLFTHLNELRWRKTVAAGKVGQVITEAGRAAIAAVKHHHT